MMVMFCVPRSYLGIVPLTYSEVGTFYCRGNPSLLDTVRGFSSAPLCQSYSCHGKVFACRDRVSISSFLCLRVSYNDDPFCYDVGLVSSPWYCVTFQPLVKALFSPGLWNMPRSFSPQLGAAQCWAEVGLLSRGLGVEMSLRWLVTFALATYRRPDFMSGLNDMIPDRVI